MTFTQGDYMMNEIPQSSDRYCSQIGPLAFMGLEARFWATYDPRQHTKKGDLAKFVFKDGRTLLAKITATLKAGYSVDAGGDPTNISAGDVAQVHRLVTIHADRPPRT